MWSTWVRCQWLVFSFWHFDTGYTKVEMDAPFIGPWVMKHRQNASCYYWYGLKCFVKTWTQLLHHFGSSWFGKMLRPVISWHLQEIHTTCGAIMTGSTASVSKEIPVFWHRCLLGLSKSQIMTYVSNERQSDLPALSSGWREMYWLIYRVSLNLQWDFSHYPTTFWTPLSLGILQCSGKKSTSLSNQDAAKLMLRIWGSGALHLPTSTTTANNHLRLGKNLATKTASP